MARRARTLGFLALGAIAAGCAPPAEGEPAIATQPSIAQGAREKWFVELDEAPTARGGDPILLAAARARFRRHATIARVPFVERYTFDRLWSGISLEVDPRSAAVLGTLPGVRAMVPVVPVVLHKLPPSQITPDAPPGGASSSPDLATALAMTGADVAQSALGLTGKGVRVGVIDSGVDFDHPDLGGCFGPGCRVAFGFDFVGDEYDSGTAGSTPVPDAIPDDCDGHGTHVAGIIGASGVVTGVAPGVVLGAYRVFGCDGTTDADVMIKAMEMAEADGMRVINMSIGSSFQWPDYPTSKATEQLVEDGVVVVCSIGNSGTSGVWAAGAPGVGRGAIGTASYDNTGVAQPAFTISADDTKVGFKAATTAPDPPKSGSYPVARTGTTTTDGDGCINAPTAGSLVGQIALIRRGSPVDAPGTCTFYLKAKAAMDAGAAGVVLYNNLPGQVSPAVGGNPPITIPVVAISEADGDLINARLDAGPVTMTWTPFVVSLPSATGGRISSFSSYGLAADLSFKPDLGAPGGNIHSTYPLELGGYASLSGTSMASPHVAGAVALILEARPDVPASRVRDLLQNTAIPALSPAFPSMADAVHRQGAGMIHVDTAVQSLVTISPATLALGESEAGPASVTLTLTNDGATAITYDVSHLAAASTIGSYWSPIATAAGAASVVFDAASVTVPAGGSATLGVTLAADDALVDRALYGGYLVFTPQGGGPALRVPYAGFKGDYQSIPMLVPTAKGYPWLAKRPQSSFLHQPDGATFTLQSGDFPYVAYHLDHGARRIKLDVFDAVKGKPYGNVVDVEHVAQGSTQNDTTWFGWDGRTLFNKQVHAVPNGDYVLHLSALKALGDADNPADWETWTSPVVTINHP